MATSAPAATIDFLQGYYEAIDAQRAEEAVSRFAPDATVRVGSGPSQPWMQGLGEVARELRGVTGTRHRLTNVIGGPEGGIAYEVEIAYEIEGGGEVTLAGAAFCTVRDGLFQHQSLYIDLAPVHAAVAEAG